MKKTYQEPNAEYISLVPQDKITGDFDFIEGEMGTKSNTLFD